MFRNFVETKLNLYNWNWGKGGIHSININALNNGYEPVTRVEMWIPDSKVRDAIIIALKSIFISQQNVFGRPDMMQNLTYYGNNNDRVRFMLDSLDKADIEKVFLLIHHHKGSQLPLENIQQGLEKLFPQKTGVEIKTLLLIAAAAAAAGAVYWGYQKLSGSQATLFNSEPDVKDESEERTLFNSFGFGPE